MLESVGLTHFQIALLDTITFDLANIPGVTAVVLGGSYARGTARPESDIDVALYYAESSPPEIEAIRRCAEKISIQNHPQPRSGGAISEKAGWFFEPNSANAHVPVRNPSSIEIRNS